jgi:hypothetical protein
MTPALFGLKIFGDRLFSRYTFQEFITIDCMPTFVFDRNVHQSGLVHLTRFPKRLVHIVGCFRNGIYGETEGVTGDGVRHRTTPTFFVSRHLGTRHQRNNIGITAAQ